MLELSGTSGEVWMFVWYMLGHAVVISVQQLLSEVLSSGSSLSGWIGLTQSALVFHGRYMLLHM
jgi:hypothetical protein